MFKVFHVKSVEAQQFPRFWSCVGGWLRSWLITRSKLPNMQFLNHPCTSFCYETKLWGYVQAMHKELLLKKQTVSFSSNTVLFYLCFHTSKQKKILKNANRIPWHVRVSKLQTNWNFKQKTFFENSVKNWLVHNPDSYELLFEVNLIDIMNPSNNSTLRFTTTINITFSMLHVLYF